MHQVFVNYSTYLIVVFVVIHVLPQSLNTTNHDGNNADGLHTSTSAKTTLNNAKTGTIISTSNFDVDSETNELIVADFSKMESDADLEKIWKPMTFRGYKPTLYSLEQFDGCTVVKADSRRSSSGLVRRIEIDINEYPVIEWTWRVENIFEKGDVFSKSGDDYPARIYVIFDYPIGNLPFFQRNLLRGLRTFYGDVPTRAINYIYESKAEVGTIVPNPYSDLVTMVVVDSGTDNLGKWVTYRRNILEDYHNIFGEEPPKIGGIAIMSDSDDTGESAIAYFGDIRFLSNDE